MTDDTMLLTTRDVARFFFVALAGRLCSVEDVKAWCRERIEAGSDTTWMLEIVAVSDREEDFVLARLHDAGNDRLSTEAALALLARLDYCFSIGLIDGKRCAALIRGWCSRKELPGAFSYLGYLIEHIHQGAMTGAITERQARIEVARNLGRYSSFIGTVPMPRMTKIERLVPAQQDSVLAAS